jgi:hypothetical protein
MSWNLQFRFEVSKLNTITFKPIIKRRNVNNVSYNKNKKTRSFTTGVTKLTVSNSTTQSPKPTKEKKRNVS